MHDPVEFANSKRNLWVEPTAAGQAADCVVFLDGELYRERVKSPKVIRGLQSARKLPPFTSVYVSAVDAAVRHVELTCSTAFSQALAGELQPWIEENVCRHTRYFLCGLSLSGLAAAFAALAHPDVFCGALCQSPSAWWNDEWLAGHLPRNSSGTGRFRISVGDQELDAGITHPPSGLLQKVSQRDSCRKLFEKLGEHAAEVCFSEFEGGHDCTCWARELPGALSWLLDRSAESTGDEVLAFYV